MRGIGVNLFSLRTMIKTEEDFLATTLALCEMGYDCVQFSGAPFDAEMIKRVSEKSGVKVVVTHVPYERILNDTDRLMSEHESFGCHNIGLGTLPREIIPDEAACLDAIEALGKVADRMAERGFKFFYHNHHTDCYRHGGTTILDRIIESSQAINLLLDTYWLQYGGLDIIDYTRRLAGRIECVHLKDYKIITKTSEDGAISFAPIYAPVGSGNLDFGRIIPAMCEAGTKYYLVEQDNAVAFPNPLDEVKSSIDYLMKERLI